nr:retrovirus-related Pol polyprotein from transposon TNT 1-94 [Tanacetum cinerariifolium]
MQVKLEKRENLSKNYILLPLWIADKPFSQDPKSFNDDGSKPLSDDGKKLDEDTRKENECNDQEKEDNFNSTNNVNIEELLQFKLQEVWTLVDLLNGKRAICTKWIFRNKKDKSGIMIINKARLVAQGYTQEEVIDYDEVFSPVARIEAIRLFLTYASFKDFIVYQIDVKSAFLYGKIEVEVFTEVKTASTSMETQNPLLKDEMVKKVDVHMYRYQVNLKVSHLHDVKRIFRKSTTEGCQFLRCRLISGQCKK